MSETFVLFELVGTTYAVRSELVQQMEMIEQVTPVPNAPPFVDGVMMVRGKVIPALNLRARFGFEKVPYSLRSRMIIVNVAGRTIGLVVDTAREFVAIPPSAMQLPPETISGLSGRYLERIATVGERMVLILNMEEVLNHADMLAAVDASV
jgi:purine-binding chemotaxis protein CheW